MRFTSVLQVMAATLLLAPVSWADGDSTGTKDSVTSGPVTAAQAVNQAIRYTGFDSLRQLDRVALERNTQHVLATDTTIPFLQEYFDARPAWIVEFHDIKVLLFDSPDGTPARNYQVYIDEETGVLLKIVSRAPWYDPLVIRKANTKDATTDFRKVGEAYTGFPGSPPTIDFALALDTASFFGLVSEAMEIVGLYVSYKDQMYQGPAWDIHFYGLRNIRYGYPDSPDPEWVRNHIRVIVNAETGRWVLANNIPYAPEE